MKLSPGGATSSASQKHVGTTKQTSQQRKTYPLRRKSTSPLRKIKSATSPLHSRKGSHVKGEKPGKQTGIKKLGKKSSKIEKKSVNNIGPNDINGKKGLNTSSEVNSVVAHVDKSTVKDSICGNTRNEPSGDESRKNLESGISDIIKNNTGKPIKNTQPQASVTIDTDKSQQINYNNKAQESKLQSDYYRNIPKFPGNVNQVNDKNYTSSQVAGTPQLNASKSGSTSHLSGISHGIKTITDNKLESQQSDYNGFKHLTDKKLDQPDSKGSVKIDCDSDIKPAQGTSSDGRRVLLPFRNSRVEHIIKMELANEEDLPQAAGKQDETEGRKEKGDSPVVSRPGGSPGVGKPEGSPHGVDNTERQDSPLDAHNARASPSTRTAARASPLLSGSNKGSPSRRGSPSRGSPRNSPSLRSRGSPLMTSQPQGSPLMTSHSQARSTRVASDMSDSSQLVIDESDMTSRPSPAGRPGSAEPIRALGPSPGGQPGSAGTIGTPGSSAGSNSPARASPSAALQSTTTTDKLNKEPPHSAANQTAVSSIPKQTEVPHVLPPINTTGPITAGPGSTGPNSVGHVTTPLGGHVAVPPGGHVTMPQSHVTMPLGGHVTNESNDRTLPSSPGISSITSDETSQSGSIVSHTGFSPVTSPGPNTTGGPGAAGGGGGGDYLKYKCPKKKFLEAMKSAGLSTTPAGVDSAVRRSSTSSGIEETVTGTGTTPEMPGQKQVSKPWLLLINLI